MSLFDWRFVPGFEIQLNKGTPDYTIVRKIGEIMESQILHASEGFRLLNQCFKSDF